MKRGNGRTVAGLGRGAWIGAIAVGMLAASAAMLEGAAPRRGVVDATLALVRSNATGPVMPGDVVTVELRMRDLGGNMVAGYQAFLEFDDAKLSFVSGTYPAAPFGLAVIDPIGADGSNIDLAAGIDVFNGQLPTSADAVVAELTFMALEPACAPAVSFRKHDPATRLTTEKGDPIKPLLLVNPISECACDWNCDGVVNSQDFFDYVPDFLDLEGEFNQDGVHNSQDYFDFIACFFNRPAGCM